MPIGLWRSSLDMDLVSILVAGTLVLLPAADDAGCWNYLLDVGNLERRMLEVGSEAEEYASEKHYELYIHWDSQ